MTSKYNARRDAAIMKGRYLEIQKHDSNRKKPIYPPTQADDYLTPVTSPTGQATVAKETDTVADDHQETKKEEKENPYQSLLASNAYVTGEDHYVKLKHSASFSVLESTPPPSISLKPAGSEPDCMVESMTPQLLLYSPPPKRENIYTSRIKTL